MSGNEIGKLSPTVLTIITEKAKKAMPKEQFAFIDPSKLDRLPLNQLKLFDIGHWDVFSSKQLRSMNKDTLYAIDPTGKLLLRAFPNLAQAGTATGDDGDDADYYYHF